jgi:hypothetical protein
MPPSDFQVTYSKHSGSLAPQFQAGYRIQVGPGLSGGVTFTLGYGETQWAEPFSVADIAFARLHAMVVQHQVLYRDWPAAPAAPGSPAARIEVVADGRLVSSPERPDPVGARIISDIGTFLEGLVAPEVWGVFQERCRTRT